jgi:fibro-slime domain-containing protein
MKARFLTFSLIIVLVFLISEKFYACPPCSTPPTPSLVSPLDGAGPVAACGMTLEWEDVECDSYRVYMSYTDTSPDSDDLVASPTSNSWDTGCLLPGTTYYWCVRAYNDCDSGRYSNYSVTWDFTTGPPDTDPPEPSSMTWSVEPHASGSAAISMTATTVSDLCGVEYFFDETSGNPGGSDSGWQDSPIYIDIGLDSGTQYCYQVQARDKACTPNYTGLSSEVCATTRDDIEKWSFAVISDSQGNDDGVNTTMLGELANEIVAKDVEFVLVAGDLVQGDVSNQGQLISQFNTWVNTMLPVDNAGIGIYPCRGNHDALQPNKVDAFAAWNSVFSLPDNGPSEEENVTYSFVHENALIISLDEYVTEHQVNQGWLEGQLDINCRPHHIFVFGHEPAFEVYHQYCLAYDLEHAGYRDDFWHSLEDNGGRTYFCGHDHIYNHAMTDDDGDWSNNVHQFILSPAGGVIDREWSGVYNGNNNNYTVENYYNANYVRGYLLVEVDGLTATVTWMKRISAGNYQAQDEWAYEAGIKDTDPPTPTPMTWASIPEATGSYSISMEATEAVDNCFGVEYFFDEISGNPGGSDSGWQDSRIYEDTGLSPGIEYIYRVKARDKSWSLNEGDWSSIEPAATPPLPPEAPSGLDASAVSGFPSWIYLSWTHGSSNEVGFKIQRAANSGGPWDDIGTVEAGVTYYDVGLNSSLIYYYQVCAYNAGGNSGFSNEDYDSPCPSNPQGLIPTAGERKVDLDWDDNDEDDLGGYNVYRSTTPGGPYSEKLNEGQGLVTSSQYSDDTVTNGTTYYYVVTAVDSSSNESAQSDEVSVTPEDKPPAVPANLSAAFNTTTGKVDLNWDDNDEDDLGGYKVYRATASAGSYVHIATTDPTESEYHDDAASDVVRNRTSYYVVTAFDQPGGNESGFSGEALVNIVYNVRNNTTYTWYYSIQAAINNANDADQIVVFAGTYNENIQFTDKKITLTSAEPSVSAPTIIDGGNSESVITFSSDDADSTIVGFIIRNGNATNGGGIYCDGASPTITGCVISDNTATNGGGLYVANGIVTLIDTIIRKNNASSGSGGAIYGGVGAYINVKSCTIGESDFANTAIQTGGAIYGCGGYIHNTTIRYNSTNTGASAIASSTCDIINSVIMNNTSSQTTAAALEGCSGNITNCTIVNNNNAVTGSSGIANCSGGSITNCIIYHNGDVSTDEITGSSAIPNYCCIESYSGGGGTENIIGVAPELETNDYHLKDISPCIDAGDPDYIPANDEKDRDGGRRIRATAIDMGAHEFGKEIYVDADAEGANDGTSWTDAYNYLQDALNSTETQLHAGDEIWVADGTYYPDEDTSNPEGTDARNSTFQLEEKVAIYGGFDGGSNGEKSLQERNLTKNKVTLSGDIDAEDWPPPEGETIYSGNSYHVVTGSDKSLLDGFKITEGYVEEASIPGGAGIYCVDTSPVIRNCTVTNNFAKNERLGGGIYTTGNSSPKLVNCLVVGNFAQKHDCGGIYHSGTGTLELINCTVVDNAFDGIHCDGATLSIDNSIIWHNRLIDPDNPIEFPIREIVLTNGAEAALRYSSVDNGQSGIIVDASTLHWDDAYGYENITGDPEFVNWGRWRFKLAESGEVVNVGTSFNADEEDVTIYDFRKNNASMGKLHTGFDENEFTGEFLHLDLDADLESKGYALEDYYKTPSWDPSDGPTDTVNVYTDFYEWFTGKTFPTHKGDRVIQSVPWTCINPDKAVFRFSSEHFFPIDGWCNSGSGHSCDFCESIQVMACPYPSICNDIPLSFACEYSGCTEEHNYFFTFQYHGKFTYIPGQKLFLKSSDDLFIAINNRIVVDRGGHFNFNGQHTLGGASWTTVWFKEGKAFVYENDFGNPDDPYPYDDPYNVDDITQEEMDIVEIDDFDADPVGTILLEPYKTYDFDLFFAQRATELSILVAEMTPGETYVVDYFELGDYHLTNDLVDPSPCIDAADNDAVPANVETDLDSIPRFLDDPDVEPDPGNGTAPIVDMGAYEYEAYTYEPIWANAGLDKDAVLPDDTVELWDANSGGGYPELTVYRWTVDNLPPGCQVDFDPLTIDVEETSNLLNPTVRLVINEQLFETQEVLPFTLKLTASDPCSNASDTLVIRAYSGPVVNRAPIVYAGNYTVDVGQWLTLDDAVVTDDDKPLGFLRTEWSLVQFPLDPLGEAIFDKDLNQSVIIAKVKFTEPGTNAYLLKLWASDLDKENEDYAVITVNGSSNAAPDVEAGSGYTSPSDVTLPIKLDLSLATVFETPPSAVDSDAGPQPLQIWWTVLSYDVTAVDFDDPTPSTLPNPPTSSINVTFKRPGTHILQLSAYDGDDTVSDITTVTIYPKPQVDAGLNKFKVLSSHFVDVPMSDAWAKEYSFPYENMDLNWEKIGGTAPASGFDENGQATIEKPTFLFYEIGTYELKFTATDQDLPSDPVSDTVWVTILEDPVGEPQPRTCTALYAGVSNSDGTGDVYRKLDAASSWEQISQSGTFGGPVLAFCDYNGNLYAGSKAGASAAGVWIWDGLTGWTQVTDNDWVANQRILQFYALIEYNGNLYAGTNVPNKLFKYDGDQWSAIDITGHLSGIGSLYVWKNKLFLDAGKPDELGYFDSTCDCWQEAPKGE